MYNILKLKGLRLPSVILFSLQRFLYLIFIFKHLLSDFVVFFLNKSDMIIVELNT